eukprot:4441519-Pyramimonas_sp.AAC.1
MVMEKRRRRRALKSVSSQAAPRCALRCALRKSGERIQNMKRIVAHPMAVPFTTRSWKGAYPVPVAVSCAPHISSRQ